MNVAYFKIENSILKIMTYFKTENRFYFLIMIYFNIEN